MEKKIKDRLDNWRKQSQAIQPSMRRTANCYDNAVMESFFASLKAELVPLGEALKSSDAPADGSGKVADPEPPADHQGQPLAQPLAQRKAKNSRETRSE